MLGKVVSKRNYPHTGEELKLEKLKLFIAIPIALYLKWKVNKMPDDYFLG